MSIDEELRLLERIQRRDEPALRELVARRQDMLLRMARRMLGSREDAEEVVVQAFLRLWRSSGSFRGECSVKSYLCTITLNLCRERLRRRPVVTEAPLCEPPADHNELLAAILSAMSHLPIAERELLALYYLEELEYEEICSVLGISYDVLRTRLVRARKKLRDLVGVDYE